MKQKNEIRPRHGIVSTARYRIKKLKSHKRVQTMLRVQYLAIACFKNFGDTSNFSSELLHDFSIGRSFFQNIKRGKLVLIHIFKSLDGNFPKCHKT